MNEKETAMMNEPSKAGRMAAEPLLFGPNLQISVFPVHTRFDAVQWFVSDFAEVDEFDMPAVVGQFASKADAIHLATDLGGGFHVSRLEE